MPYRIDDARESAVAAPPGPPLVTRWIAFLARPAAIVAAYRRQDVVPDLVAGLTVAMVALPQAIAYASIANLPAHYGLYSAIVAGIVGSLWGSSHHLSTGPTNAASILVLSIMMPIVAVNSGDYLVACSILAVMVGLFRVLFGFVGFGVLVNYVSRSVLLGFTAGAGLLIAVNQLQHLLGLAMPPGVGPLSTLVRVTQGIDQIHLPSLAIGSFAIASTLIINRFARRLPGSLVALILATAAVAWLGVDRLGVNVVGDIPGAVPEPTNLRVAWSILERGVAGQMVTGALAVSLLGLIEAISISRAIARTSGQRLDVNQEFVGQGLANIATGFLSGYPCSGSFTRSAVNHQAGARTAMAGVYTGIIILGGSALLAPSLHSMPRAAVAGVVMLVAWGMIDRQSIRRVVRSSRSESMVMGVTLLATILFPLEFAVLSGVIFSLAMHVYRESTPHVYPVVPDPTFRHFVEAPAGAQPCPQLAVMNIRGALFFGATQHVEDLLLGNLRDHPDQRLVLLRMHGVTGCDFTGIEMLESVVHSYRERDGDVYMVQVRPAVMEIMRQSGFCDHFGEDHFLSQEEAIDLLFETAIDPARCWHDCSARIFAECQAIPKRPARLDLPPHRYRPVDPSRLLNVEEVEELIRSRSPMIVDVREPEEYALGHLTGARLISLQQLMSEIDRLPRDRPLLLICRAGRRSKRALRMLIDLGFEDVQNLKGGILSWKAADRPLEVD
jgi:SulP family sulfate permease